MTFACCVYYPTLRCFPRGAWVRFRCARHGHSSKCKERSQLLTNDSSTPLTASQDCQVKMGLEKVNYETSIIMDEDEFNRSIEPILSKNDKVYAAIPDRDPNDINAHLKVSYPISVSAHRAFRVSQSKLQYVDMPISSHSSILSLCHCYFAISNKLITTLYAVHA